MEINTSVVKNTPHMNITLEKKQRKMSGYSAFKCWSIRLHAVNCTT